MGESRKEKEEVGQFLDGTVCHFESAQGGSHHLAIDGCPSPVVKQAPMGLPKHWGIVSHPPRKHTTQSAATPTTVLPQHPQSFSVFLFSLL